MQSSCLGPRPRRSLASLQLLAVATLLLGASGCARSPKDSSPAGAADPSNGANDDAGYPGSTGGSSGAGEPSGRDAGAPSDLLGNLGHLLGGGSDGGPAPSSGDGGVCAQQICWDVFDCYIFHPDKTSCGFTACEGFICK